MQKWIGRGIGIALLSAAITGCTTAPVPVSFPTEDGGVVHGELHGSGARGLVLAHGARFTKESWAAQIPSFTDAGFQVLAIDFRGRGLSHGAPGAGRSLDAHLDVLAAVRGLRARGASSVSVLGASFGGSAAALAAVQARPGEIERLVLLAAGEIAEPERMQGRKLFLVAREDSRGAGDLRLPGIREQFERAPGPKSLVLLEGSAHAQFLFESDQAERLMGELLKFLQAP